ncbi:TPA: hypothetical protein PTV45_000578 [Clostridium botulinum]|nr:hypothetical protein [Clostridium botulinum]
MEYDQRYNQALGYMLDLYTDNHIVDCITTEQFKELFDMFIDSKKDIDRILYGDEPREEIVSLPYGDFTMDYKELICKRVPPKPTLQCKECY